jgi:hypothetical protein
MSRLGSRNQEPLIDDETDVKAGMIHLDEFTGCLGGRSALRGCCKSPRREVKHGSLW